jgi:transcriptional regulator with XRE-family HTH domain
MPRVSPAAGPTALRVILGRQLRALRERAGLSYDEAARAIYLSSWTVRRMEGAEAGLKLNNVKTLLYAYGVTDRAEIETFLTLCREANQPGWWHSYSDVLPPWFRIFPGLEQAADLIRGYEPQCVPGLLQTEDYARAITQAGHPSAPPAEIGRLVALRLARQHILARHRPPRLWVVLDETVLHRAAGGPAVMHAQLTHLIQASQQPNITLQVLPFAAGPHPAMYGLFYLFRFPAPEMPDIIYGENMTSAFYLDKPHDVTAYTQTLDRICVQALPATATAGILRDARKEY